MSTRELEIPIDIQHSLDAVVENHTISEEMRIALGTYVRFHLRHEGQAAPADLRVGATAAAELAVIAATARQMREFRDHDHSHPTGEIPHPDVALTVTAVSALGDSILNPPERDS